MPLRSNTWIAPVDEAKALGFVEAGGKPPPNRRRGSEVFNDPHVAVEGENRSAAIGKKLQIRGADLPFPRVGHGQG
jgi:hypothetical protein